MNTIDRSVNYFCQYDFKTVKWDKFDYSILSHVGHDQKRGKHKKSINSVFIMLDTETSKSTVDEYTLKCINGRMVRDYYENVNYVVKWSLAINYMGINVGCVWGSRPSECVKVVETVNNYMSGDITVFYIHNLTYDWQFLRKFFIRRFDEPVNQINTKPHYPIMIEFDNGVQLRDSLILAQRSLEKWGADLNVQHQKAVGKWDYEKIRNQADEPTNEEIEYFTNDVICGVECLDRTRKQLRKQHSGMPYTATGVVRNEAREIGEQFKAHAAYVKTMGDFDWYCAALKCYHGGYTHANRHIVGWVENDVECYDFASSYPYVMVSEKYPCERFKKVDFDLTITDVLESGYACMVELYASDIELKDYFTPMPNLQISKMEYVLNPIVDNGRILKADFIDIYLTEIDLEIINKQYNFGNVRIKQCWIASKDYLPKWFTDYVYRLFKEKTELKGGDPVQYAIAKSKVNSLYG